MYTCKYRYRFIYVCILRYISTRRRHSCSNSSHRCHYKKNIYICTHVNIYRYIYVCMFNYIYRVVVATRVAAPSTRHDVQINKCAFIYLHIYR